MSSPEATRGTFENPEIRLTALPRGWEASCRVVMHFRFDGPDTVEAADALEAWMAENDLQFNDMGFTDDGRQYLLASRYVELQRPKPTGDHEQAET